MDLRLILADVPKKMPRCTLHTLPPELRDIIFKKLVWAKGTKTPNIIKALRPDSQLYEEVLHLFYASNEFYLPLQDSRCISLHGGISESVARRLIKVRFDLGYLFTANIYHNGAANIRSVSVHLLSYKDKDDKTNSRDGHPAFRIILDTILNLFPILGYIEIVFPYSLSMKFDLHIIEECSEYLGTAAHRRGECHKTWFWQAEKGTHLQGLEVGPAESAGISKLPSRPAQISIPPVV